MLVAWGIAAVVFIADFFIKAHLHTNFLHTSTPVIKNIFHITVIENTGAAFGILHGKTTLLIFAGVIFMLVFLLFMKNEEKKTLMFNISCGLILGGALSNLYDRIFLGFVIDYIDLRIWPVFNLSDSCITVGAFLLIWLSYRDSKKQLSKKD